MKRYVIVNTSFTAQHSWPECELASVLFLQYTHRHNFYVTLKIAISHNNRDIEIIRLKNAVDIFLDSYRNTDMGSKSCEDIAEELLRTFHANYVSVLEDNENGAEIYENY